MSCRISLLVALVGTLVSLPSMAEPSETDKGLSQSLFEQAKALMDSRNFAQACPKFEESQRLDPGGGTLLNLALCHESEGKIATAWSEFKEALSVAKRDGREERVAAAAEHIAALEPKLPWVTLSVTAPAEGQVVLLDGAPIGAAAWGAPVAVNPGRHTLSSTAPGRIAWDGSITLAAGQKITATVPPLVSNWAPRAGSAPRPAPELVPPKPSATRAPSSEGFPRKGGNSAVGWVIGGAGVVSIGAGAFFGLRTLAKKRRSDRRCPTDTTCSDEGVDLNSEAVTSAWLSNVGFGLGLAGVGVGAYLIVSGTEDEPSGVGSSTFAVGMQPLPGGTSASFHGRF
jgi:hypothetical protein